MKGRMSVAVFVGLLAIGCFSVAAAAKDGGEQTAADRREEAKRLREAEIAKDKANEANKKAKAYGAELAQSADMRAALMGNANLEMKDRIAAVRAAAKKAEKQGVFSVVGFWDGVHKRMNEYAKENFSKNGQSAVDTAGKVVDATLRVIEEQRNRKLLYEGWKALGKSLQQVIEKQRNDAYDKALREGLDKMSKDFEKNQKDYDSHDLDAAEKKSRTC